MLLLTIEPPCELDSVTRSSLRFEHRDIFTRAVTSKHEPPLCKLWRLQQRQKSIDQNIEPLLRVQTRQHEDVRVSNKFRVAGGCFNTQRDHLSVIQSET